MGAADSTSLCHSQVLQKVTEVPPRLSDKCLALLWVPVLSCSLGWPWPWLPYWKGLIRIKRVSG